MTSAGAVIKPESGALGAGRALSQEDVGTPRISQPYEKDDGKDSRFDKGERPQPPSDQNPWVEEERSHLEDNGCYSVPIMLRPKADQRFSDRSDHAPPGVTVQDRRTPEPNGWVLEEKRSDDERGESERDHRKNDQRADVRQHNGSFYWQPTGAD